LCAVIAPPLSDGCDGFNDEQLVAMVFLCKRFENVDAHHCFSLDFFSQILEVLMDAFGSTEPLVECYVARWFAIVCLCCA
jgi:hypothetical protein